MTTPVEFVLKWIEDGSNSMQMYSNIISAASDTQPLNLETDAGLLIATITNVFPMLQPIRIETNTFAATAVLLKIVSDWQDPGKKVNTNDVLSLLSASGTIVATVVVLAEIAPEAAAAGFAVALASDLSSTFNSYLPTLQYIWPPVYKSYFDNFQTPLSTDAASLYLTTGNGGNQVCTYDEVMNLDNNLLFTNIKEMTSGGFSGLNFSETAVPGSFTPVDDQAYLQHFCSNAPPDDMAQCLIDYK
ncbi:hypothetical protein [Paraburkholderia sp.]|uniref:hypothetical protein n=1 Tax=Paraburkholderia sp. TaxID=1926495 RepID=UPI0039E427C5